MKRLVVKINSMMRLLGRLSQSLTALKRDIKPYVGKVVGKSTLSIFLWGEMEIGCACLRKESVSVSLKIKKMCH